MRGGGGNANTFHTDDGRFLLRNLQAGEYQLIAQTPDGLISTEPLPVTVVDGRGSTTEIPVIEGAALAGVLVDDVTGAGIAQASVSAQGAPGSEATAGSAGARTDGEGKFSLRGLSSGRYVIQVYPPSGVYFAEIVELQAGESREITLRERAPGEIRIVVRDEAGAPVANAQPMVRNPATGMVIWPNWGLLMREGVSPGRDGSRLFRTDESGVNLRRHVPPGRYEITASMEGYSTAQLAWVEVQSGQTSDVTVTLRPTNEQPPR